MMMMDSNGVCDVCSLVLMGIDLFLFSCLPKRWRVTSVASVYAQCSVGGYGLACELQSGFLRLTYDT